MYKKPCINTYTWWECLGQNLYNPQAALGCQMFKRLLKMCSQTNRQVWWLLWLKWFIPLFHYSNTSCPHVVVNVKTVIEFIVLDHMNAMSEHMQSLKVLQFTMQSLVYICFLLSRFLQLSSLLSLSLPHPSSFHLHRSSLIPLTVLNSDFPLLSHPK